MSDDCPIPVDLNVQQFWRDHNVVTDEMACLLYTSPSPRD